MRTPRLSPGSYRTVTLVALVALAAIVVTGAAVRLTGSGLGCPTWPNCEPGRLTPRTATDQHAMVEFVNRLVTGIVSLAVIVAVLGSMVRVPRRRDLTAWSWSLVVGVLAQIVLGGATVLLDLWPPIVAGHFLLSMVLIFCAVVLHRRAGEPDRGERRPAATPEVRWFTRVIGGAATIVLVTGTAVTGAGPHGGDEAAERLDLFVPDIARIHSIAVWILLAASVWTFVVVRRGDGAPNIETWLRRLIAVSVAQGTIGYAQYFAGVPEWLVALHIIGALLVWIAAVRVGLATTQVIDAAHSDSGSAHRLHQSGAGRRTDSMAPGGAPAPVSLPGDAR